jgi:fibronectin type 3 domain-containing protein
VTYAATVSWTPPSLNTNGSASTDIVSYRVYYGTDASNLASFVLVSGATTTTTIISGLSVGTYYFAVSAVNSAGTSSVVSNVVSRAFP